MAAFHKGAHLVQCKAQVGKVQLHHRVAIAQARERQRGHAARNQHQVEVRGRHVEPDLQQRVGARIADVLVIVNQQHQRPWALHQAAQHGNGNRIGRTQLAVAVVDEPSFARDVRVHPVEGGEQRVQQGLCVVAGHHRHPGDLVAKAQRLRAPLQRQRGLAAAGRAEDHHAGLVARLGQPREQPSAFNATRLQPGQGCRMLDQIHDLSCGLVNGATASFVQNDDGAPPHAAVGW